MFASQTSSGSAAPPDSFPSVPPSLASARETKPDHNSGGVTARRSSSLYGVHAYHTKVPPEAIASFIAAHTTEGDTVLDPFCGSGMTGVAASSLGRRAVLLDLSPAAVHIASNYTRPCDPREFEVAVATLLARIGPQIDDLYATTHLGQPARIEHLVWSDVHGCPRCGAEMLAWDRRKSGLRDASCPACGQESTKSQLQWVGERAVEANLSLAGARRRVTRSATDEDLRPDLKAADLPWHPTATFDASRPMWRRGHSSMGIRTVADFYSTRNLAALAMLWQAAGEERDERLRSALRFSLTAIANRASRRYQWNAKRPTNVLGGTLYVSSLRYEWNVLSLWRRKVRAVARLFASQTAAADAVTVLQGDAAQLPLADASVDYCFTDPPFGSHIVYSDSSLLWEAWLDDLTDRAREAIVVRSGDHAKTVADYGELMRKSFQEVRRVLKPDGRATIVFQASDPKTWSAVYEAATDAGLGFADATTLDKGQPSFKQVKGRQSGEMVAQTDVVLTFSRRPLRRRDGASPLDLGQAVQAARAAVSTDRGRASAGTIFADVNARLLRAGARPIGLREVHEALHFMPTAEAHARPPASFARLYPAIDKLATEPTRRRPLDVDALAHPTRGRKNTPAYNTHSYPTKVPVEAIEPYIEHHTRPGDLVLDAFCGSGMTGLAARRLGRHAVLNDLSFGAAHLAWNVCEPCDPAELQAAARSVLAAVSDEYAELFATRGRKGGKAFVRWTLYSTVVACPDCGRASQLWREATDKERGSVARRWRCPGCDAEIDKLSASRLSTEAAWLLAEDKAGRFERAPTRADLAHVGDIEREGVAAWHPHMSFGPDREMYIRNALQIQGIADLADFWTTRNRRALAVLWREIHRVEDLRLRQALSFAFTNTAWHATRMRRYNARGGQRPLTGTLYIPQLSIEANPAIVFAHKIGQLSKFYETSAIDPASSLTVTRGSAARLSLPDDSVDYCFTDPPFGSNIFYADCAAVWESWLGEMTPPAEEAVVNRSLRPAAGGKTLDDYAVMMERAFAEIQRVLKPNAWATVVFQSSDAEVWAAFRTAVERTGFDLASAGYLDKTQQSHKGYKGRSGNEDVASFDVVLNLHKPGRRPRNPSPPGGLRDATKVLRTHLAALPPVGEDPDLDRQRTLPFLHSLLVREHFNGTIGLEVGQYALVRRLCEASFESDEQGLWRMRTPQP